MGKDNYAVNKAVEYWLIGNSKPIFEILDENALSHTDLLYIIKSVGFIEVNFDTGNTNVNYHKNDGIDVVIRALNQMVINEDTLSTRVKIAGHLDRFFLFSNKYEELFSLMEKKINPLLFKSGSDYTNSEFFKMMSSIDIKTMMSFKKTSFNLMKWAEKSNINGMNQFYFNYLTLFQFCNYFPIKNLNKKFSEINFKNGSMNDLSLQKNIYSFFKIVKSDENFLKFLGKKIQMLELESKLPVNYSDIKRINKI